MPSVACTGDDGAGGLAPAHGHGNNVAGTTHIPAGLVIDGSPAAQTAVTFALAQLGKPYVFDAAGPNSYDCSGLTMAAWATAGVALEHWTGSQVDAGTPEPLDLSEAVAGDLVLIPGADGTMANPGHVGMIIGYVDTPGRAAPVSGAGPHDRHDRRSHRHQRMGRPDRRRPPHRLTPTTPRPKESPTMTGLDQAEPTMTADASSGARRLRVTRADHATATLVLCGHGVDGRLAGDERRRP